MPRQIRILMVSSSLEDDGGLPVSIGQLSIALADLGHTVEITGQHALDLAASITSAASHARVSVTPFRYPWHVPGQIAAARQIWRLVQDRCRAARVAGDEVVVHVHGVWVIPVLAGAQSARAAGARTVILPHGMLRADPMRKSAFRKGLVFQVFVRPMLARAAAVQTTSQAEADDLRRLMPQLYPRVVPLGVASPMLSGRPRSDMPCTAGYLGRIIPIKNLDTLLRAWAAAADLPWLLRLAGPGEGGYIQELRRLAASLGIADRVQFEPAVPHSSIGEFLEGLDLFIHPSRSESFALSIGEALAAGVPVIATTAAPWSGMTDHDCGWAVPPTQSALEQAIRTATTLDRQQRRLMGRRGAMWIQRDFGWPSIARRYVDELYTGLS